MANIPDDIHALVAPLDTNGKFVHLMMNFALASGATAKQQDILSYIIYGNPQLEDAAAEKKRYAQIARACFLGLPNETQATFRSAFETVFTDTGSKKAGGRRKSRKVRRSRKGVSRRR